MRRCSTLVLVFGIGIVSGQYYWVLDGGLLGIVLTLLSSGECVDVGV